MTKFNPNTHIIGKVYDLTQENMQLMIKFIELQKFYITQLELDLEKLEDEVNDN